MFSQQLARRLWSRWFSYRGLRSHGRHVLRTRRNSVERLEDRTLLALYVGDSVAFLGGNPTFFETSAPDEQAATSIRAQFDFRFLQESRLFDGASGPVFGPEDKDEDGQLDSGEDRNGNGRLDDRIETFVVGDEPVVDGAFPANTPTDRFMPFELPDRTFDYPDVFTSGPNGEKGRVDDDEAQVFFDLPVVTVSNGSTFTEKIELFGTFVAGTPDLRVRPAGFGANVRGNDQYQSTPSDDQIVHVNVAHGGSVSFDIQLQEDDPRRLQSLFFTQIPTEYRIAAQESADAGWTVNLPAGISSGGAGATFAVTNAGPTNLRVTLEPGSDVPLGTTKELTLEAFYDASTFSGLSPERQLELRHDVRDSIKIIVTVVTAEDAADDQTFGGHFVVNHNGRSATDPNHFLGDRIPGDGIVDPDFFPGVPSPGFPIDPVPPVPASGIVTLLGVLQEIRNTPGRHRITFADNISQVFVNNTMFIRQSMDIIGTQGATGLPGVEVTFAQGSGTVPGFPDFVPPFGTVFDVNATGVLIEGLIINTRAQPSQAAGSLLRVEGGTDIVIHNNFIGTDRTGQNVQGAALITVEIVSPAVQFLGNVVATNPGIEDAQTIFEGGVGVLVTQPATFRGNRIGLEAGSTTFNGAHGILLEESAFGDDLPMVIGGPEESDGNLVQGFSNGVTVGRNGVTLQGNELRGNETGAFLGRGTNLIDNTIVANEVGVVDQAFGNVIRGNRIGVEADGGLAGNRVAGLHVSGSTNTQVGGTNPGDANIIGGNDGPGILITANPSDGVPSNLTIQGNFIGTDASGRDLGNQGHGVFASGERNRNGFGGIIGGQNPGQGNVIRFNDGAGIAVANGTTGRFRLPLAAIQGNFSLQVNLGTMVGLQFASEEEFVAEVQRRLASFPEVFAAHIDRLVLASTLPQSAGFNAVGNSISDNRGPGIDRFNVLNGNTLDGITPNDDTAENDRIQNFPVITAATFDPVAGTTTLSGSLTTLSNAQGFIRYRLDFYLAGEVGPAGELEGKLYLGSTEIIQTSATMPFTFTINGPVGGEFTATAIKIAGISEVFGTSEFSTASPGLVVNDARDLPDLNVNDSIIDVDASQAGEQRTLRAVLQFANRDANRDRITFDIPGGGVPRITVNTPLPVIVNPVQIDATTQPNAARVELRGRNTNANEHGLQLAAGNCVVRGLAIGGFGGHGLIDTSSGNNEFTQLIIGANAALTATVPNGLDGIHLLDASNNVISDSTIVGNRRHGVQITGASSQNNRLFDNRIGTLFPNSGNGVTITNAPNNRIGLADEDPNTIGGNLGHGLLITGASAAGNLVFNNHIGIEQLPGNLTAPLGNLLDGIRIENAPNNFLGDTGDGERNFIATNLGNGIAIVGAQASTNRIFQNFIGTALDGQLAFGNLLNGVLVDNAPNTQIGVSLPTGGNVITGNGEFGVQLKGAQATNNNLQRNFIGPNGALE